MGRGIASNAAAAEIPVHAWNRTAEKLGGLPGTPGLETFATAREAVAEVDSVVTILGDAEATIGEAGQGSRLKGEYPPSFRLALAAKDARLAVAAGTEAGAKIPAIEAIATQMAAVAAMHPDDDLGALFRGTSGA